MNEVINIKISGDAVEYLRHLTPEEVLPRLAKAMDRQNNLAITQISSVRMRGNNGRPFPVSAGILGIRSGVLYKSLRAAPATVTAAGVESAIGSNVSYAAIHEFGGVIHRAARAGSVRLRTDAKGQLLRRGAQGNLATFAAGHHKRAKEVAFQAQAYDITIPARRPVRHGLEDRLPEYGADLSQAILTT